MKTKLSNWNKLTIECKKCKKTFLSKDIVFDKNNADYICKKCKKEKEYPKLDFEVAISYTVVEMFVIVNTDTNSAIAWDWYEQSYEELSLSTKKGLPELHIDDHFFSRKNAERTIDIIKAKKGRKFVEDWVIKKVKFFGKYYG